METCGRHGFFDNGLYLGEIPKKTIMKTDIINPARKFFAGEDRQIEISHCANITLEPDEQVTFLTKSGNQYDVAYKSWGYYATPSTNGRLQMHNLRTALVINSSRQLYVMLCEVGQESLFHRYLEQESQQLLVWLDTEERVEFLKACLTEDD